MKYWTQFFKVSLSYVGSVFAVGFLLGTIRVLWLVPKVGIRTAELLEMPVMVAASFLAARWVVRRLPASFSMKSRLALGIASLSILLSVEVGFTTAVRGLSLSEYLETRDPVSSTAYFVALGLFSLMPWLVTYFGDRPQIP